MIITVTYLNQYISKIQITGHANSNRKGEDLVCAGVSSITFGMLNAIDELIDASKYRIHIGNEANISVEIIEYDKELAMLLQAMYYQLKTIALSNTQYIKIREV